jgi:hypothetical protein
MQPQLQVYEGTWEEIAQHASEFIGRRVRLTIVNDESVDVDTSPQRQAETGHLYFGMFKGEPDVTEEDFKMAEWRF